MPRRYASSTVSGFASDVTSASAATSNAPRRPSSKTLIDSIGIVVGVPPPRNTDTNGVPAHSGAASSASRRSASTYGNRRWSSPAYVLKSQYPHLVRQNGTCTYSPAAFGRGPRAEGNIWTDADGGEAEGSIWTERDAGPIACARPARGKRCPELPTPALRPVHFFPSFADDPELVSTRNAAMKASCGTSTRPTRRMRFLPSFCFSSSFRLRVMSPP